MTRRLLMAVLVGVPLVLLAAAPSPSVEELVRRGNAAFADKDFAGAVKLYEQAGFKARGVRRGYYTDNREDALIMWRDPEPRPLDRSS